MKIQGDTKRPHSVNAEFDPYFTATPLGGGIIAERALRRLNVCRTVGQHLPERNPQARYSTLEGVYALMASQLLGGRGIGATQRLREDPLAREVFGLDDAPSQATMYRILCDLSGLDERTADDVYEPAGPRLAAMDLFGEERKTPKTRRIVPEEPEAASPGRLAMLQNFLAGVAKRCHKSLPVKCVRVHEKWVVFGDATDLEVDGDCFDAARMGRDGKHLLRWMTLMVGPLLESQELMEGARDEGRAMPGLVKSASQTVREMVGRQGEVLGLFDAAYFERDVISQVRASGWGFIVCANQQCTVLERIAGEMPETTWTSTGPDAARGWRESQVGCFVHLPADWSEPVTIVARRWIKDGEAPGCWRYSFVATNVEPRDLPRGLVKKHDYCSAIWMLYGTKQGRENHYKTALRDLGLHHPPSCRLGVNQAFYAIASAASNIAMVLRYAVAPREERGIEFWRFRDLYMRIAGYLVRSARRLTVRLSGVCVGALRQVLWEKAFAAAGRL